jgi:hypothetical protein
LTNQDSIFIYATDGTLKNSWHFDPYSYYNSVFVSDSNTIFLGTDTKIIKVNASGDLVLGLTTPDEIFNDIVFDPDRKILFVAYSYLHGNSYKYSKRNGVVYAYNENFSKIAEYWLWDIFGANISLTIQNNGSLLIGIGGEQNKIIKLKPLNK